jgi:hypothetical protein
MIIFLNGENCAYMNLRRAVGLRTRLGETVSAISAVSSFPAYREVNRRMASGSEDLEALTFPDESFDLVITQDVFEHVLRPAKAFAEICLHTEARRRPRLYSAVLSREKDDRTSRT